MTQDPLFTFTAFCNASHPRRQFLTTLNLKSLLRLVHPVMQRRESGAGLRANPILARGIARQWRERGEVQCLKPITIAISSDFQFTELPHWNGSGAGTLKFPIDAVLDVCDGIQQITALDLIPQALANFSQTDWPVHLIETFDSADLLALTHQLRTQIAPVTISRKRKKAQATVSD
jgi:hypothetical protein